MKNEEEILESLIAGGIIGVALGALISKSKGEEAVLGAIAGAASLATFQAGEIAKSANIPVLVEEDNKLYEIQAGGVKRYIKDLPKSSITFKKHYKLK